MSYILYISVRFHDGRYHGADDWPPSPARLFQALVSAAAKPALHQTSRDALGWLEKLDAPIIAAPVAHLGQHVSLYVPNNDLDAKGGDISRVAEIRRATKHIRPMLFDASVPLFYAWRFDSDDKSETHAKCILEIAEGLYQLGRGVDMAWAFGVVLDEADAETYLAKYQGVIYRPSARGQGTVRDCPIEGTLASLEHRHQAGAARFRHLGNRTEFANVPKPRFRSVAYNSPTIRLLFDLRRTTVPGSPFAPWPLKEAAALVQKLRGNDGSDGQPKSGAFAKLAQHFDSGLVSKVLIGRDAKEADKALRLRILPLPSIGHAHADRNIRRVLVEVPPDCPIRVGDMGWAFAGLEVEPPEVDVSTGEILSSPVELVVADDYSMLEHYGIGEAVSSCLWHSVTPLALPEPAARRRIEPVKRREQAKNGIERLSEHCRACHEVAQAMRHAGLRHRIAGLRVQCEPFEAKSERAEAFAAGTRFAKERLWHVEIEFSEPVSGMIVLGDGRYLGLGLMAPVRQTAGVIVFAIVGGLAGKVDHLAVARSLRRAVMARVQDEIGKREKLSVFFTGHEEDGSVARHGQRSHLAYVFDNVNERLLVLAPHFMEKRNPSKAERENLRLLEKAIEGMSILRAGEAGVLSLERTWIDTESDPLFSPSVRWITQTSYQPTRYCKAADQKQAVIEDVLVELSRRGFPKPTQVTPSIIEIGPRGGVRA